MLCSDKLGFYNSQVFCRKAGEQGPVVRQREIVAMGYSFSVDQELH